MYVNNNKNHYLHTGTVNKNLSVSAKTKLKFLQSNYTRKITRYDYFI